MENELLGNGRERVPVHLLFLSKRKLEKYGDCVKQIFGLETARGTRKGSSKKRTRRIKTLIQAVNFDQGVARGVVYGTNYCGVATGCQGGCDGRFGIVRRGQAGRLDLCLLGAFPIVVSHDSHAICIAQIQESKNEVRFLARSPVSTESRDRLGERYRHRPTRDE
jgi:hypothetical protein